MGRFFSLALVAAVSTTGCRSKNPVGFWDIEELSIETPTVDGARLDAGTLEWTTKKAVTVVLRYEILDPATVPGAAGATGATGATDTADPDEGPAWMPPVTPPLLFRSSEQDGIGEDEAEGFTLSTETGFNATLGISEIRGGTMTLTTDEALLGAESGVTVTLHARR